MCTGGYPAPANWYLRPFTLNPYTGWNIFCMHDPSHAAKNTRNAMYNSRLAPVKGQRTLDLRGKPVTWNAITNVWDRERERMEQGVERCTTLTHAGVVLNAWSKMRVNLCLQVWYS